MSGEFIYTRKFIIFKNDKSNIPGINPRGHGLLELRENKGNLTVNVERGQVDSHYNVYIIGTVGEEIIETYLGKLITDDRGKGSVGFSFNPRNVELSNNPITLYTNVVLRVGSWILLVGDIGKDGKGLNKYLSNVRSEEYEERPMEETVELMDIFDVEEEQVVDFKEELDQYENIKEDEFETEKDEIETKDEEIAELEELEIKEETIIEEVLDKLPIEDVLAVETVESIEPMESMETTIDEQINYNPNKFNDYMTNYVLSILRFFPYVKPFNVEFQGYEWWRIESDGVSVHRGFLPFYNYLLNMYHTYPHIDGITTCEQLIERYEHYLFGMYKVEGEIKYYLYGVPGSFSIYEHPYRGATGFNTWYPSKDGLGYWLLYINPRTGKVLYPLNPMIPTY